MVVATGGPHEGRHLHQEASPGSHLRPRHQRHGERRHLPKMFRTSRPGQFVGCVREGGGAVLVSCNVPEFPSVGQREHGNPGREVMILELEVGFC